MTDISREPRLSDLRSHWKANGGNWHGPHVETWTIPEDNFLAFFNDATRALRDALDKAEARRDMLLRHNMDLVHLIMDRYPCTHPNKQASIDGFESCPDCGARLEED